MRESLPRTDAPPPFRGEAEVRPSLQPRPALSHAVFDFDGTLSWLRHGWPALMRDVMGRHLPPGLRPSDPAVTAALDDIVLGLNGRPTLMQMAAFAEWSRGRGGTPPEPEMLRREYQDRLDRAIADRLGEIRSGAVPPEAYAVAGALPLVEKLARDGWTLAILSTTPVERVREEATILGLAPFFGPRIFGGTGDPARFSKRDVLVQFLRDEGVTGENLLSFGDGPVEIAVTKDLGGLAVAICSDEDHHGSGRMDPHKRRLLLEAGADAALPDFREAPALVDWIRPR